MENSRNLVKGWIGQLSLRAKQILFLIIIYIVLLIICVVSISPEQYDVNVGDVSPKTITARKDIVDELTTERRRKSRRRSSFACLL